MKVDTVLSSPELNQSQTLSSCGCKAKVNKHDFVPGKLYCTRSIVLSLISERPTQPDAFSSAAPKQGTDTHFNTSESIYTADRQTVAGMYILKRPLLEIGCKDVTLQRQLKLVNQNIYTYLR